MSKHIHGRRLATAGGLLALGFLVGLYARLPADRARAGAAEPGNEARVRELKLELPPVTRPKNTYVNAVRVGDLLYVAGTGPTRPDGSQVVGRLGQDLDVAQGRDAARLIGLNVLAVVRAELGNLDRVTRVVKTLGMVNATADFKQHPQVVNGFSDLMVEVFGEEAGKGARSSVGMASLPGGIPVEIEAIFQVERGVEPAKKGP